MEKLPLKLDSPASHLAIIGIVLHEKRFPKDKVPAVPTFGLEIEFKVNGVEVPFEASVKEMYDRMIAQVDELAAKRLHEMATLTGLDKLIDTIRQTEQTLDWEVRKKIKDVLKIDLPED
jgi:hypothetical protein